MLWTAEGTFPWDHVLRTCLTALHHGKRRLHPHKNQTLMRSLKIFVEPKAPPSRSEPPPPTPPPPLSRPRAPCSVSRMLPDAGAEARAQCSGPRQQAGTLCLPIPVRRTACTSKPAPCLQEPGSRPQTECPPHGVAVVDDQEGKMGLRNALLLLGLLRHKAEEGKSERNTRHTGIGTESKGYPSWGGKERQGKEELCPHVPCSWSAFVSWHQLL